MDFIAAGLSDVGLQREVNEDSFTILPEYRLFLVADGMGGHKAGDVASRMATHAIGSFFRETKAGADQTWPFHFDPHRSTEENRLITSIKLANRRIFDASVRHHEVQGMGTTLVGALFDRRQSRLFIAHVGDSRAYRFREGVLDQITEDHSLVNDYLAVMPHMSEEQKAELPKNVITRALGMQESVDVDIGLEQPRSEDIYLLCSDGLSGMVSDERIREVLATGAEDLEVAVRELVDLANGAGGEDNITVVAIRFSGEPGDLDTDADTDAALRMEASLAGRITNNIRKTGKATGSDNGAKTDSSPVRTAASDDVDVGEFDTLSMDEADDEPEGRDPDFATLADDKLS